MRKNIVVVGIGQGYRDFLRPAIDSMKNVNLLATIDIVKSNDKQIPHIIRKKNYPISNYLSSFKKDKPIVFLEHAVNFHTPDAINLVMNGYKVIIEKPYSISLEQQNDLENLVKNNKGSIALLEYYVSMKTSPLRLGMGQIKQDSFYFLDKDILIVEGSDKSLEDYSGLLRKKIGKVEKVEIAVLEGEGDTGRVHHRGAHTTDIRLGGGMINDLGLHAFGPLLGLTEFIGHIDLELPDLEIKTARCNEYKEMAKKVFNLSGKYERFIGESYAEMNFKTLKKVQVNIKLGKYTPHESNLRYVKLISDKGVIYANMDDCFVEFDDGSRVRSPKTKQKYVTVIKSAFSELFRSPPYTRDNVTEIGLKGQRMIFSAMKKGKEFLNSENITYDYGDVSIF